MKHTGTALLFASKEQAGTEVVFASESFIGEKCPRKPPPSPSWIRNASSPVRRFIRGGGAWEVIESGRKLGFVDVEAGRPRGTEEVFADDFSNGRHTGENHRRPRLLLLAKSSAVPVLLHIFVASSAAESPVRRSRAAESSGSWA